MYFIDQSRYKLGPYSLCSGVKTSSVLWIGLAAAVFIDGYDLGTSGKERNNFLKGRQNSNDLYNFLDP